MITHKGTNAGIRQQRVYIGNNEYKNVWYGGIKLLPSVPDGFFIEPQTKKGCYMLNQCLVSKDYFSNIKGMLDRDNTARTSFISDMDFHLYKDGRVLGGTYRKNVADYVGRTQSGNRGVFYRPPRSENIQEGDILDMKIKLPMCNQSNTYENTQNNFTNNTSTLPACFKENVYSMRDGQDYPLWNESDVLNAINPGAWETLNVVYCNTYIPIIMDDMNIHIQLSPFRNEIIRNFNNVGFLFDYRVFACDLNDLSNPYSTDPHNVTGYVDACPEDLLVKYGRWNHWTKMTDKYSYKVNNTDGVNLKTTGEPWFKFRETNSYVSGRTPLYFKIFIAILHGGFLSPVEFTFQGENSSTNWHKILKDRLYMRCYYTGYTTGESPSDPSAGVQHPEYTFKVKLVKPKEEWEVELE